MNIFEESYAAWLAASYQTKEEMEDRIFNISKALENPTITLQEGAIYRETKEYLELRLKTKSYKKTNGWSTVYFDGLTLFGEEVPPSGCWVQWKTADDRTFVARFKEDAVDHFYPKADYDIEDVIAWRWYYAREF